MGIRENAEWLGKAVFVVDALRRRNGETPSEESKLNFPSIDLQQYRRGTISKIDVTDLAPDDQLEQLHSPTHDEDPRQLLERQVHKALRKQLMELPISVFSECSPSGIPIETHTSETSHHLSCLYVLIMAHISTGFSTGRNALFGSLREQTSKSKKRQNKVNKPRNDRTSGVIGIVDYCVERVLHLGAS